MTRETSSKLIWLATLAGFASFMLYLLGDFGGGPEPQPIAATDQPTTAAATPEEVTASLEMRLSGDDLADRLVAAKALGDPRYAAAVPALLGMFDERSLPDKLRVAAIESLAAEAICRTAVDGECSSRQEEACEQVLARMGPAAAGPLAKAILKWQLFVDGEELKRWVRVLGRVGDANSAAALNRALGQDIAGMDAVVAEARREIEGRTGAALPPAAPDGPLCGQADATLLRPLKRDVLRCPPMKGGLTTLPRDGVLRLTIDGVTTRSPGSEAGPLEMEFIRRDGKWETQTRAYAPRYNKRQHPVTLLSSSDGPPIKLKVDVLILNDFYVRGGMAALDIELKPEGDGFEGRFVGQCNFIDVSGKVKGIAWEHRWAPPVSPISAGDHPRLLLRKDDIPALRQRAKTPFGQAVLRALRSRLAKDKLLYHVPANNVTNWGSGMDLAIGHGFLFTVFGDQAHGQRGLALYLPRCKVHPYQGEHGEGWPAPYMLFPYGHDMLRSAGDSEQREYMDETMVIPWITTRYGLVHSLAGGVPPGCFGAPGLAALTLLHEPGKFDLDKPEPPKPILSIAPPSDAAEAPGAPVNVLEGDKLIRNWLMAGPFPVKPPTEDGPTTAPADPLAALGGPAAARPREGDTVEFAGRKVRFGPLPKSVFCQFEGPNNTVIDYMLWDAVGPLSPHYLYCLLKVDANTGVLVTDKFNIGSRWSAVWISGKSVPLPSVVELRPGVHTVLARVDQPTFGPALLVPADYRQARVDVEQYRRLLARWQMLKDAWAKDKAAASVAEFHRISLHSMRTWFYTMTERTRDGGQSLGYQLEMPYVNAAWTAGEQFFPDTPMPLMFLPKDQWRSGLGTRHLIFTMSMAPPELRPALAEEFRARFLPDKLHTLSCLELAAAFVNYPWE